MRPKLWFSHILSLGLLADWHCIRTHPGLRFLHLIIIFAFACIISDAPAQRQRQCRHYNILLPSKRETVWYGLAGSLFVRQLACSNSCVHILVKFCGSVDHWPMRKWLDIDGFCGFRLIAHNSLPPENTTWTDTLQCISSREWMLISIFYRVMEVNPRTRRSDFGVDCGFLNHWFWIGIM